MSRSARLIPSLDLVQRTLLTDVAYTISRMNVLERLPGNPIGIPIGGSTRRPSR
jgi:hypothetical protein